MKFLQFFTIVCIAAGIQATPLHSGNFQISGSFQKHPWLANHRLLVASKPAPVPVAYDNTIPDSTVPIMPVIVEMPVPIPAPAPIPPPSTTSFHTNVDVQKLVNDLVGVKIALLRHVQGGISQRFDQKVERLEKFGEHVEKNLSKGSSAGTTSGGGAVVSFDANLSVSDGTRIAPLPETHVHDNNCEHPASDFTVTDPSLDSGCETC